MSDINEMRCDWILGFSAANATCCDAARGSGGRAEKACCRQAKQSGAMPKAGLCKLVVTQPLSAYNSLFSAFYCCFDDCSPLSWVPSL